MLFLIDKKDLGIYLEMILDGILVFYEKGVINGKYKNFDKEKMIVIFLMGIKKLYDFVNNNFVVEVKLVDYVNYLVIIMK